MKYIIFGFEHYNPLGIVRSLGENGIKPYGIIIRNSRKITSKSKFFKRVFFVNSIACCLRNFSTSGFFGQEKSERFVEK